MPPVKILEDKKDLVSTKSFPKYLEYNFDEFNPVQSAVFDIYNKHCSVVIASPTGSGKSGMAEMFMAHEINERKGKTIYLAPMKALAKEKYDDWTNKKHSFSKLNVSICTGDYQLTPERRKELQAADIIIMTCEMFNARLRNFKSEHNDFLKSVGTLVCDEFHLITVPSRGDHLEVGLMKFCKLVKKPRLVCLSATMPNVKEMAEWISYVLTKNDTYLIESKFRPCPLGVHYETYPGHSSLSYDENEECKVNSAISILKDYPDDKFLMFVHTKRTGQMLYKALKEQKYKCEFHSADLTSDKREKLENDFKYGDLQVLIATSTLAWGANTPARRVVILGVHRGIAEVESYDILQEIGRSGRPGFDPRGDAYILLPSRKEEFDYHKERIKTASRIESRLLDYIGKEDNPHYKILAFHIVSEIHHGYIKTKEDLRSWYEQSLAHFQANDLDDEIVEKTIGLLIKCGAVKVVEDEYEATMVGKISSMFYYSPFDVADLRRNFGALFNANIQDNDMAAALALSNIDSIRMGIVSRAEKEEMGSWSYKIRKIFGQDRFMETAIKGGYIYFALMNGMDLGVFGALGRTYQSDFSRLNVVLNALDGMSCKWKKKDYFSKLQKRIIYGVRADRVHLCDLPEVGKVRAEKLWAAGLKTYEDIFNNPDRVKRVLNLKEDKINTIINTAKEKHFIT